MTSRTCIKCGDALNLNAKLDLMECVSGKHIEPVNLMLMKHVRYGSIYLYT